MAGSRHVENQTYGTTFNRSSHIICSSNEARTTVHKITKWDIREYSHIEFLEDGTDVYEFNSHGATRKMMH